jgi:hypothetical protein
MALTFRDAFVRKAAVMAAFVLRPHKYDAAFTFTGKRHERRQPFY